MFYSNLIYFHKLCPNLLLFNNASSPDVSFDKQLDIVSEGDDESILLLALNPNTHSEILNIIEYRNPLIGDIVKYHPNYSLQNEPEDVSSFLKETPEWVIEHVIYNYSNENLLNEIIKADKISKEKLEELSKEPSFTLLQSIAKNPKTPPTVLNTLSQLENQKILFKVALNKSTNIDTLEKLADHPSDLVKMSVIENPKMTMDILIKLYMTGSQKVLNHLQWVTTGKPPHYPSHNPFLY